MVTKTDSKKTIKKSVKKPIEKLQIIKTPKQKTSVVKNSSELVLEVKKMSKDISAPEYILDSDIGLDLKACETVSLKPMEQKIIKTGIKMRIPDGYVGLIRDRAGIVSNMNVHTAAGTFDPAYRGEVSIVLINMGEEEVEMEEGMRIAQMIILPVARVKIKVVETLSETQRGEKGFGSTGIKEKLKAFDEISKAMEKEGLL
jgi:dUTP pyrophosphatase